MEPVLHSCIIEQFDGIIKHLCHGLLGRKLCILRDSPKVCLIDLTALSNHL